MFALTRAAAVLFVIAMKTQARQVYMPIFIGVLFAHYVLSIWYARRKLAPMVRMQVPALALGLLVAATVVLPVVAMPSLVLYFGVHHALTEGYMLAGRPVAPLDRPARQLLVARMALAAAVYAFVLCRDQTFWSVSHRHWMAVTAVAFVAFAVALVRARRGLTRAAIADMVTFEVLGVGASMLTLIEPIIFWDVVFYHLVVWIILPLRQLPGVGKVKFVGQTVAVSAVFYCLTPAVNLLPSLDDAFWLKQSELWAYVHITTSFATSAFNPRWMSRWFAPRSLAAATARPA